MLLWLGELSSDNIYAFVLLAELQRIGIYAVLVSPTLVCRASCVLPRMATSQTTKCVFLESGDPSHIMRRLQITNLYRCAPGERR